MTLGVGDVVAKVKKTANGWELVTGEAQHIFLVVNTDSRYLQTGDTIVQAGLLVKE